MTFRNPNRERGADAPRRLTAEEQAAIEARFPLRHAAARNVVRAVELSHPELFEPVVQPEPVPADVANFEAYRQQQTQAAYTESATAPMPASVVNLDTYPQQAEAPNESQAELARQAIANIFNPQQESTDVEKAA